MIKPIFLIGLPKEAEIESVYNTQNTIDELVGNDYYVLTYLQNKGEDIIFNVFYEKDIEEIELDKLKEMVYESYKNKNK